MANQIISRADARTQGLTKFFTGDPCKNGHLCERWTDNAGCLECARQSQARWYAANRDSKLAKNKTYLEERPHIGRANALQWRNKNLERARENAARWYANPENRRAHNNNRRAHNLAAEGTHTPADLVAILKAQHHCCVYCPADLRKVRRHLDHIHPLARGGSNDRANLQWLCVTCNLSKGAKDPLRFAQERGRLL